MKRHSLLQLSCLTLFMACGATGARAQQQLPADADPTRPATLPESEAQGDWQIQIGAVSLYGPAFVGSKDYQLLAAPFFEVRFKDRFFISPINGVGFDLIKTDNFRAGPVVSFQAKRRADNDNPFRVLGKRTTALRGLGDVPNTIEVGGYGQYEIGGLQAKVEVKYGVNGHKGLIAKLGVSYSKPIAGLSLTGQPGFISIGPRATIVDSKYNNAYFGITQAQSRSSGLRQFNAKGGIQSYGIGASATIPVSGKLSAIILVGFDRLSGSAGDSPLVRERGSRNQASAGAGLVYRFGL